MSLQKMQTPHLREMQTSHPEESPGRSRIQIRPMRQEDLDEVAAIEAANFSIPWKRRDFERYLEDETAVFLTAEISQNPNDMPENCTDMPENCADILENCADMPEVTDSDPADPARAAGYIGCLFAADEGDITNVSVHPAVRRAGVGRTLVRELLRRAGQRGCKKIFLEVRASNEAAIRLYQAEGFVQAGIRKNYYDAPKEDALLMCREAASDDQ